MTSPDPRSPRIEPERPAISRVVAALERELERDHARTEALAEALATELEPLVGVRVGAWLQSLRPIVVSRGCAARVARAVRRTARDLVRVLEQPGVVASLPGLGVALGAAPIPTRMLVDLDLLRPDGALHDDGTYDVMELNAGSCVGGLVEIERIGEVMARWYGDVVPLRWPRPATDLARALVGRYGRDARFAWVVLPGGLSRGDGATEDGEAFSRVCAAEGVRCEPAEADAIRYDGRAVTLKGARVDVLIRVIAPVEWCTDEGLADLRAAVGRGHVALFSSPYDLLLNHKGALAELSRRAHGDPRGAVIPWTRFARPAMERDVDVLVQVRERPSDYVLKPGIDRQGRSVVLGREAGERWVQHLVAAVLADDCVVQRWVEPPRATLPFLVEAVVTRAPVGVVTSPVLARGSDPTLCARTSVPGATQVMTHPYAGTTGLVPVVELDV